MHTSVQILLMDSARGAMPEQELLPRLHPEERSRYHAFTAETRRRSWLAGRALALSALARVSTRVDAAALRTDESGGMRYGDGALHLSLSHCRDLIGIALATVRIGLDIEWPRPRLSVDLASRVFSMEEAERLDTLSASERQDAFYTLWTLKEAACKAAGLSLWESLRHASFDPGAGSCSLEPPFPAGEWTFMHACLQAGWHLALAVRGAVPEIECWSMAPTREWRREPLVGSASIYAR